MSTKFFLFKIMNTKIRKYFLEKNKKNGLKISLIPNKNNTVQPVVLMRLGIFVPTLKSTDKRKENQISVTDVTSGFKQLSIAKLEGYENIRITGIRLDMDNDFKTWIGIIRSFSECKVFKEKIHLSFKKFARFCGIRSARFSKKLRDRLDSSLNRIATNTISFSNKSGEYYVTHLVQSAEYSLKKDLVFLQADPKIFELYQFDKKVLLQLKAIKSLPRKESAQALYTFIESLPKNPIPISMERLRSRLNLISRRTTQNFIVRKAMKQLKDIGYLDYTEFTKSRKVHFLIHYRRPKLFDSRKN